MPEYMQENLEYKHVGEEIHPARPRRRKFPCRSASACGCRSILSIRTIILASSATGSPSWLLAAGDRGHAREALQWALSRGSRSGRVAWQFAARRVGPLARRRHAAQQARLNTALVEVVAAVIERPDGSFLLAQRPAGKVYAGYWEFPGGKVEPGEPLAAALSRELHEELGIDVESAHPWIVQVYAYPHAKVRLNFFRVRAWHGEPHGKEAQQLAWQHVSALEVAPLLPATRRCCARCGFRSSTPSRTRARSEQKRN